MVSLRRLRSTADGRARGGGYGRPVARLLLVRHGESEWNAVGRWQGWADPPLSELGRRQAELAARAIGGVDAVAASDLQRALATAELIADDLGVGPVLVDAALRERDAGEWTGLTRKQIEQQWPGALANGERPDGYEGDAALLERVLPALLKLQAQGDTILVITHGGVIGAVDRHLDLPHERTPNLGGRVVDVESGRLRGGESVLLVDADDVAVTAPPEV
jgi:broad specificity phosphatase PhoE